MREIVLDTETTGFNPYEGDRLVEIGCLELDNHVATGKTYHQYINPEREVPEAAVRVHGLDTLFLKDKPLFKDIAKNFLDFIGDAPLVIHNAEFDLNFLNAELSWINLEVINKERAIDTLLMARKKFPGMPASLDALCKRFNIDNSKREKHGALLDSELLAEVYLELIGGREPGLTFSAANKSVVVNSQITAKQDKILTIRPHLLSSEEENNHQKFIKKIQNALWLEVN